MIDRRGSNESRASDTLAVCDNGAFRRLRIAILGESPCGQCAGSNCCRQNGHEFAVLLEASEYARFAPYCEEIAIEHAGRRIVERVLPYCDGRCQFLGEDGGCLIYEDRPISCRRFQCVDHFAQRGATRGAPGRFLELNPDVLARLEAM